MTSNISAKPPTAAPAAIPPRWALVSLELLGTAVEDGAEVVAAGMEAVSERVGIELGEDANSVVVRVIGLRVEEDEDVEEDEEEVVVEVVVLDSDSDSVVVEEDVVSSEDVDEVVDGVGSSVDDVEVGVVLVEVVVGSSDVVDGAMEVVDDRTRSLS